jgi:hypothetical protein
MLEGPTEYVNVWWMWSLHWFLHGIEWIVFHGHLDCFQKSTFGGRPNTKPRDHGTPNTHNHWFIHRNSVWLRARSHTASHYTWGSRDRTTWIRRCVGTAIGHFSFGLTQFHGHGSWLVCEVTLRPHNFHCGGSEYFSFVRWNNENAQWKCWSCTGRYQPPISLT